MCKKMCKNENSNLVLHVPKMSKNNTNLNILDMRMGFKNFKDFKILKLQHYERL